jgi:uncharacterized phage infection (PIP) family protein YhgE
MSGSQQNETIDKLLAEITSIRNSLDTLAEKIAVSHLQELNTQSTTPRKRRNTAIQETQDAANALLSLNNNNHTPSTTTRKRRRKSKNQETQDAANALLNFNNMTGGKASRSKSNSMNKKIHNVLQGITSRLQYVDQNLDNFSRTLTQKKKAAEVLFDFKGPGKRAVAKSRRRR